AREHGTHYRQFGPDDVRDARLIQTLRRSHYPLDQIRPVLEELRLRGGTEALRAAVAARGEALAERTRAMLTGAGRLAEYIEYREGGEDGEVGENSSPNSPANSFVTRPATT
ncbi:MerR family transcriptional regulator, partial [Streptomyces graminilatus]|uniref:MerR family transcriptional regulator n=1 Tax=Streptomyces graminilatus TaxID=1464070 RepID=UPI000A60C1D0